MTRLEEWSNYLGFLEGWTTAYTDQPLANDGTDEAFYALVQHAKEEILLVEEYISALKAADIQENWGK